MKKRIFNNRGFGLLEAVIAIGILIAIIVPLLGLFVQSAQTDEIAKSVLNANYISQDYTEKLDVMTYKQALADAPYRRAVDSYYLTAKLRPYGSVGSLSGVQNDYAHLIIYADNTMLAVMPDGQWTSFSSSPANMSFSAVGNTYTFYGDTTVISGSLEYSKCVVSINAMTQNNAVNHNISLGAAFNAILYCPSYYTENYFFSGDYEVIENLLVSDTSLIHVTTYVYDNAISTEAVASIESYVSLKNWE